jgi:hypothetical protein
MEGVAENSNAIRDTSEPVICPVVPTGHNDHNGYGFGMATQRVDHA